MGDRYFLTMICPKCDNVDNDVYFAPTCGFTEWKCKCGNVVNLIEHTGITEEMASNKTEIQTLVEKLWQTKKRAEESGMTDKPIYNECMDVINELKATIVDKDSVLEARQVIMNLQDKQIAALEKTATEQDDCILHFQARVAELKAKVDRRQMALKAIVMGYGVVNVLDIAQEAMKNEEGV